MDTYLAWMLKRSESVEWGPLQFHGVWGQLMKTGYQNSRFAHQVRQCGALCPLFANSRILCESNEEMTCGVLI